MAIQSIGFKTPPHKDGNGMPLPINQALPTMRPRSKATMPELIRMMEDALEDLADCECCFWACDGPRKPRNMVTCRKCWAIRTLSTVKETLKMRTLSPLQAD